MRTLSEIIDAVKEDQSVDHEELVYALLAVDALQQFDQRALMQLATRPSKVMTAEWNWKESFNRTKIALGKSPKEWVGWNNDPKNPEYRKRRAMSLKIWDKAAKGELPNQKRRAAQEP